MVAIYCRLSLDQHQTGLGVARQEQECRAYASARGWQVGKVYVDNDISATTGRKRPAYERLLQDKPPAILVWNLDRLVRLTKDLEKVVELEVPIYAIQAGQLDLSTPAGRAMARTVTAWSQYEGEIRTERQLAAYRQRALAGVPGWSHRPFGYNKDGTLHATEAPLIKQAYEDVLGGVTATEIARRWDEEGVRTASGRGTGWKGPLVKAILVNPRNAALRTYHGEVVGKGQWEAMVTEDVFLAAKAKLVDPKRKTHNTGCVPTTLLSGFATCERCGAKATLTHEVASWANGKPRLAHYTCRSGHFLLPVDMIDAWTWLALHEAIQKAPEAWAGRTGDGSDAHVFELQAEREAIGVKLGELADAWARDIITMEQMERATRELQARRDRVEAELADSVSFTNVDAVRDFDYFMEAGLTELTLAQQRGMVQEVFESIVMRGRKHRMKSRGFGKGMAPVPPTRDLVTFTPRFM